MLPSNSIQQCLPDLKESTFWEKYSDMVQSMLITCLDIIFLLGETLTSFPRSLTNICFAILNFSGFISFKFSYDLLKKYLSDVKFFSRTNLVMFIGTIFRIFFVTASIFLVSVYFGASLLRLGGFITLTEKIYCITRPLGFCSILVSMSLELFSYLQCRKTINLLKQHLFDPTTLKSIAYYCHNKSCPNKPLEEKISSLATCIRGCMDKDTWKSFLIGLQRASLQLLFKDVVLQNLETQQFVAKSSIWLRILGDIGMLIANYYVGTKIQAIVWTTMSFLYTSQITFQKFQQKTQQSTARTLIQ